MPRNIPDYNKKLEQGGRHVLSLQRSNLLVCWKLETILKGYVIVTWLESSHSQATLVNSSYLLRKHSVRRAKSCNDLLLPLVQEVTSSFKKAVGMF